ncbi:NAD(P)-dependent oxidoreductase [Izhakiella australiensis]|uniref:NAD(P)-dependent oxidoreductase n=1 Tax=Izhakiella australiensis TaxID=1926881 RepID=A0A1S8YMX8_9GAMM|nr:SDR family oxidoreductase [Izhakiella australiensis]OON40384.1 NAD(P)-dependent oxidoreductase [Izhakiella australiensis]
MIAITGATGQLGRQVIDTLLKSVAAKDIVAAVRSPEKAADLAARGLQVRQADYAQPATLSGAFAGVEKLLLISSSEVGQREAQHQAVIDAARRAGVKLIAYTSLLHADRSPLGLGVEHRATEAALQASGIPFVILRNGWYSENYAASIAPAIAHGVFAGAAGEGRIASAARQDYAEAAAAVLVKEDQAGKIYELAGDSAYTLTEFAAQIAASSGKSVSYQNLSEADFTALLKGAGLPDGLAAMLADSDVGASQQGLFDDSHTLSTLIGRPTTPWQQTVEATIKHS